MFYGHEHKYDAVWDNNQSAELVARMITPDPDKATRHGLEAEVCAITCVFTDTPIAWAVSLYCTRSKKYSWVTHGLVQALMAAHHLGAVNAHNTEAFDCIPMYRDLKEAAEARGIAP